MAHRLLQCEARRLRSPRQCQIALLARPRRRINVSLLWAALVGQTVVTSRCSASGARPADDAGEGAVSLPVLPLPLRPLTGETRCRAGGIGAISVNSLSACVYGCAGSHQVPYLAPMSVVTLEVVGNVQTKGGA